MFRNSSGLGALTMRHLLLAHLLGIPILTGCVPLDSSMVNQPGELTVASNIQPEATSAIRVEISEPNSAQLVSTATGADNAPTESASANSVAADDSSVTDGPIIEFKSPRGMGAAEVYFEDGELPQTLRLRFDLAGMEQLRIRTASASLFASVSSFDPAVVTQEVMLMDNTEIQAATQSNAQEAAMETIAADSPYWLTVRTRSIDGSSAQAADGSSGSGGTEHHGIEVVIPNALIAEANGQISLEWIDFYR